ncbi:hypothetical protein LAX78_06970 [Listeria marthii]|nr:hypothetical protein [Listeria marthii]
MRIVFLSIISYYGKKGLARRTDIVINPTKETNDIMKRWGERAKENPKLEFGFLENPDYLQLHKYYLSNKDFWSDKDEEYIFGRR